jgi:hypothetical protein
VEIFGEISRSRLVEIRRKNVIGKADGVNWAYRSNGFGHPSRSIFNRNRKSGKDSVVIRESRKWRIDVVDQGRRRSRNEKIKCVTRFVGRKVDVLFEIKGTMIFRKELVPCEEGSSRWMLKSPRIKRSEGWEHRSASRLENSVQKEDKELDGGRYTVRKDSDLEGRVRLKHKDSKEE